MAEQKKMVPIEDLMDATVDDLADMPAFIIPPKGHYKLRTTLERKMVNEHPSVEASFVVLETLELENKTEAPVENGTKFSQLFMMDNEFGQGAFKEFIPGIADGLGLKGKKMSEVIVAVKDIQIAATLKHKKDKEDKEKIYANVVNAQLV
jgi:hypothetical protein